MAHKITLSANRADSEPWRLRRLARFVERLPEETTAKLLEVFDSKGWLTIVFREVPNTHDRGRIAAAWSAENENPEAIEYTWDGSR